MADVDELIDEALANTVSPKEDDVSNSNSSPNPQANSNVPEPEKPSHLLYRRVKKGEKEAAKENAKEAAEAAIREAIAPKSTVSNESEETETVEHKPTTAELKAKLRAKRQGLIDQRSSKKEKERLGALTPIYYCDGAECRNITKDNAKCCPKCRCFYYCSAACQTADWVKHKDMCGKNPTPEGLARFDVYLKARDAAQALYLKTRGGDYITVMNEKADLGMPACMFASVAEKSNVLFWKTYMQNSIYTTAKPDTIGTMAYKLEAAMAAFPDKKVYLISVLLDRIRDEKTTECILRLFIADAYGGTMESPADGKITKQVIRYTRKAK